MKLRKLIGIALVTLLFGCLTTSAVSAEPPRFQKGKHYQVVAKSRTKSPVLTCFFAFHCAHCYRYATVVSKLGASLPKGARLVRSHVDFNRSASLKIQHALSRSLLVARRLNVEEKLVDAIFRKIHKERKAISTEADIRAIFVANGVSGPKFDSLINSFGVKRAAKRMKRVQTGLMAKRVLNGTPTFIVNGKYKLVPQNLRSVGDYKALVRYLMALKR